MIFLAGLVISELFEQSQCDLLALTQRVKLAIELDRWQDTLSNYFIMYSDFGVEELLPAHLDAF